MADKPVTPKQAAALTPDRIKGAEFVRVIYSVTPPADTDPEALKAPSYWRHIANKLRPLTHIEAIPEDGTWYAEYLVQSVGSNWAKVALLRFVELSGSTATEMSEPLPYDINFGGPMKEWRVVAIADKRELKSGCKTREEAELWAKNWARAQAH